MTTEQRGLFVSDPSKLNELTMLIHKSHLDAWKSIDKDYIHFLEVKSFDEDHVDITFEYNPNWLSYLLRGVFHSGVRHGIGSTYKEMNQ